MIDLREHGIGAGGLQEFFGDGSDGVLNLVPPVISNPTTTALKGGNVAYLYDKNPSTVFTTNAIRYQTDIILMDFGSTVYLSKVLLKGTSTDIGGYLTFYLFYSDNGTNFTQIASANSNTPSTPTDLTFTFDLQGHRYWRIQSFTQGSYDAPVRINEVEFVAVNMLNIPVTLNSGLVVKQYTSVNIENGTVLTVSNPCRGLILYSQGDVTINGTIDMSQKAGIATNGNILPIVLTKKDSSGNKTIDKYFKLTTILQALKGGSGGNGGYGGGLGGSYRSNGGTGGVGRQNLGGFGGGGGGGGTYINNIVGGAGGSIPYAEICSPVMGANGMYLYSGSYTYTQTGRPAYNGGGGSGSIVMTGSSGVNNLLTSGGGGACLGGGGGGSGGAEGDIGSGSLSSASAAAGQYAGGLILIIAKGNIIIGGNGSIKANGGNGGNGSGGISNAYSASGGGGGGGSGGGVISIYNRGTYTNNGTVQANGGIGGTGGAKYNNGEDGGAGTSGSVGTILVQQI